MQNNKITYKQSEPFHPITTKAAFPKANSQRAVVASEQNKVLWVNLNVEYDLGKSLCECER